MQVCRFVGPVGFQVCRKVGPVGFQVCRCWMYACRSQNVSFLVGPWSKGSPPPNRVLSGPSPPWTSKGTQETRPCIQDASKTHPTHLQHTYKTLKKPPRRFQNASKRLPRLSAIHLNIIMYATFVSTLIFYGVLITLYYVQRTVDLSKSLNTFSF